MKSVNTYYTNMSMLKSFVATSDIQNTTSLLIQVFTANNNKAFIKKLLSQLKRLLPDAHIIGSTSDGEIMSGKVSTQKTVLSFSTFEKTEIVSYSVKHTEGGFYSGQAVAQNLIKKNTKLIITFADGLTTNGEAFLEGLNSIENNVMVAGGLAGDNATFTKTYVFTQDTIMSSGAVAVALNSNGLKVYNDYSFNWHRIGKLLTISKVKENRVYTIDNRTAIDTYIHYLGKEMKEGLPAVGIEFPLIFIHDGVTVARAVLGKHDDGSLTFAGNFKRGEKVQFGYGNPKEILAYSQSMFERVSSHSSEAIFVYSCMARRHFMPDVIEEETLPFNQISPVAGFFTYGEFFTSSTAKLLNQSMTLVSLSENDTSIQNIEFYENPSLPTTSSTNALINLVNVTSIESMKKEMFINTQSIFETLFRTSPDGILLIENEVFIETNQKMIDIFGYVSKEEFLKLSPLDLMPKRQADRGYSLIALTQMKDLAENDNIQEFEWLAQKSDGSTFWTDILLTPIELSNRKLLYVVCRDISEKKATELEILRQKDTLYHQAYHDDLTGLPNRTLFMIELKKSLEEAKISENKLALVFIDLDRFKEINDSLGHLMGDQVITVVAKRLRLVIGSHDLIARLGGDEFLILLKDVETQEAVITKVEKILRITNEPMFIDSHRLYSSASIGISHYPSDDTDADNLLKYADAAMYKAKDEGGNNFQFYRQEMTALAYENVMMERDLRESMKAKDFEVYYQPQVHLKTGLIIGAEALVRWHHPTVGFLSPNIFIPLSIKTGLIIELDLWVMDTAMKNFSQWYKEGLAPGVLALNVNMQRLESSDFIDDIMKSIEKHSFAYHWLECELTETEVMKNPVKVIKILEELHNLGITIAIDDFGTGYSSLSYLKRLPIDKLKIDQSFIQDIGHDETAMAIVNTIIVLAQSLNLAVIAEGVETRLQEKFLAEHGCDQAQGFYYAKPLPAKDFKALLQKQKLS